MQDIIPDEGYPQTQTFFFFGGLTDQSLSSLGESCFTPGHIINSRIINGLVSHFCCISLQSNSIVGVLGLCLLEDNCITLFRSCLIVEHLSYPVVVINLISGDNGVW